MSLENLENVAQAMVEESDAPYETAKTVQREKLAWKMSSESQGYVVYVTVEDYALWQDARRASKEKLA